MLVTVLPALILIGGAVIYRGTGNVAGLLVAGGLAAGLVYAACHSIAALKARLPGCIEREFHELRIRIVSEPRYRPTGVAGVASAKFVAQVIEPIAAGDCVAGQGVQVQLSWYDPPQLFRNDLWNVELRLRPPWGYQNPGGSDFERWLFGQHYQGTGYVRRGERISRSPDASVSNRFAEYLKIADFSNAAVMRALALGDSSAISADQWELFRRTGTVHLMVVSGLHVGLVTAACYWLLGWLLRFLPQSLNPMSLAALLAIAASGSFVWLSGTGVPALRAWLMAAAVMAALLWGRRISRFGVFILALSLIVLLDPLVVHQSGFYLSFTAVGVLLWVSSGGSVRSRFLLALMVAQVVLLTALTPALSMQQATVAGFGTLSNLLAVPLLSLLLPLLLSSGMLFFVHPAAADWLLKLADWLLDLLMALLQLAGDAPMLNAGAGNLAASLLSMLAAGLLLSHLKGPWRWPVLASWLVWVVPEQARIPFGEFQLTALDVGQGSAVIIETAGHRLLFDTGPGYPGGFNLGRAVVVPTLLRTGNARLDALILSHADIDHTGGYQAVVEAMPIDRIYASFTELDKGGQFGVPVRLCREGVVWHWDDVRFEFHNHDSAAAASDNDRSCVLKVTAGQRSALLSGDISARIERRLVRSAALQTDLLSAPHHGSRSSSSARWIEGTRPTWVVVNAPRRSRYGHPHPEVMMRYLEAGAQVAITGYSGALTWRSWQPAELEQHRHQNQAYWLSPPLRWPSRAHPDDGSSRAAD